MPRRGFIDRLGERFLVDSGPAARSERLCLGPALTGVPQIGAILRQSIAAFAGLHAPGLLDAPCMQERAGEPTSVALDSTCVPGSRLLTLLEEADPNGTRLPTATVLYVLRELLAAVRALHAHAPGAFHGALGPERILLTPDLRVIVVEHVLGNALAAMPHQSASNVWVRLGLAVPDIDGFPQFGPLTDQLQVGVTALAMLLNRAVAPDEFPGGVRRLLDAAREADLVGAEHPLGPKLRAWLERLLLVSPQGPFPSIAAAEQGLFGLLGDEGGYVAVPLGLEIAGEPVASAPAQTVPDPADRQQPPEQQSSFSPGASAVTASPDASPIEEAPDAAVPVGTPAPVAANESNSSAVDSPRAVTDERAETSGDEGSATDTTEASGSAHPWQPAAGADEIHERAELETVLWSNGALASEGPDPALLEWLASSDASTMVDEQFDATWPDTPVRRPGHVQARSEPELAGTDGELTGSHLRDQQPRSATSGFQSVNRSSRAAPADVPADAAPTEPEWQPHWVLARAAVTEPSSGSTPAAPGAPALPASTASLVDPFGSGALSPAPEDRHSAGPIDMPAVSAADAAERSAGSHVEPLHETESSVAVPHRLGYDGGAASADVAGRRATPADAADPAVDRFSATVKTSPPAPVQASDAIGTDRVPTGQRRSSPANNGMGLLSDPPTGSDDLLVTDERDTSSAAGRRDRPIDHQAPRTPRRVMVLALSVLTLMAGGFAALWMRGASSAPPPATGNLRIESVPDGAEVTIDGQSRATAPAVLTVGEGRHVVDFRGNGETKRMPVEVVAGGEALARAILFADGPPGTLHVRTLPPGAQVSVDGAARGLTPLFLDAITPGERTLLVQNAAGRVMQRVIIAPGASVSVTVPVSGWLAVSSALKLKVFDNGRLAGSSETGRLLVGSGRRRIEVANDEVAFREEHLVDVKPGELIELRIALPNGVLHLTSDRPADVLVDGAPAGRTPLTNLVMRVGLHELTVSNPAFGEQRYTVLVRFGANRLEVKFADLISSKTPRPTRR